MAPPMFVAWNILQDKLVIKQSIEIHQTIDCIFHLMTKILISGDEVTSFKIGQYTERFNCN